MTLIDGDKIVTAQLYDDEYEEFTEKKMSIIDYVNAYTDEGVTTADDVLDKIKSEIVHLHDWAFSREEILRIIDKYRAESEVRRNAD